MLICFTPSAGLTHLRSPLEMPPTIDLKSFRNDHGENYHELDCSVCRKCGCSMCDVIMNKEDESAVLVSADDDEKLVVTSQESTSKGDKFVAERMRKDNDPPSAK